MLELLLRIYAILIAIGIALLALGQVHTWLKRKLSDVDDPTDDSNEMTVPTDDSNEMTVCNHCGWTVPESFMIDGTDAGGMFDGESNGLFASPACFNCLDGAKRPPEAIPPHGRI